jgi:hypothetical protein
VPAECTRLSVYFGKRPLRRCLRQVGGRFANSLSAGTSRAGFLAQASKRSRSLAGMVATRPIGHSTLTRVVIFFAEISRTHVAVFVRHFLNRAVFLASRFDRIAKRRHVNSLSGLSAAKPIASQFPP